MTIGPGTYRFGPPSSRLTLRTQRQGMAAGAGHNLLLEATRWTGSATVRDPGGGAPLTASVEVVVELEGVEVREGTGGVKPLSDADRREIKGNLRKTLGVERYPTVRFSAGPVDLDRDAPGPPAQVDGTLELAGRNGGLRVALAGTDGGGVHGQATVVQSAFGVKPYSGLFGALKVRDEVDVEFTVVPETGG